MKRYVKTVRARNWQARDLDLELAPLTAIVAENMEGKSSVPNAMRVGLTGYSPEHGKTNQATWGFIGNANGAVGGGVELGFSDGVGTNQQMFEMRRGKLERTVNRMDVKVPPVLLDLHEEFFKLSGPKRTDFIFQRMDMTKAGYGVDDIIARIKKIKLPEHTAEHETKFGEIIEEIEELDRSREEGGWTYQQWIGRVVDKIKGRADAAKLMLEQMAGTVQGMTVLQSNAELPPFDRGELAKARQHLAELTANKNTAERSGEDREKLKAQRKSLTDALAAYKDPAPEIKQTEDELAALDKEIAGHKSAVETEQAKLNALVKERDEAKALLDQRAELLQAREEVLAEDKKAKCCPKCKGKSDAWKKLLAAEEKEITAERKAIETLRTKQGKLDKPIEKQEAAVNAAKAADTQQTQRIANRNAINRRLSELRLSQTTLKVSVAVGNQVSNTTITVDVAKERIRKIDEDLKRPDVTPPDEAQLAKARTEVERLEGIERQHLAADQNKINAEEARAKHAENKLEKEVCDACLKELSAVKDEVMAKAFDGFMERVQRFTAGMMKNNPTGKLLYRDGEIGYLRGATWVTLDHFSGTEEMLTYLGLAVALAQESPVRIVFVDEWLRDGKMRRAVASRMKELVDADVIDQAIIIDTERDGYEANCYKVIAL